MKYLLLFLSWLAQTVTFTGIAFNVLVLLMALFVEGEAAWTFMATIPFTIGAGFVWLILHVLSSFIVKNNTSKLGWGLILGWIFIHIFVYLINIGDPYDVLVPMMYFNTFYIVSSVILLFIFRNPTQATSEISKPRLLRLDVQIILSIVLAVLLMTFLIVR